MLRFNTAIFYDVENLTQGSNFSKDFIQLFSLKSIYKQILALDIVDHVALQRAYANWSDPRLGVLKNEINELGIDPIQIFGFSRHQIKNAADIQLAVDAMDITLTRPHISVYVVVSGDGGFSSLAKKLHEYGRQVVGCAYGMAANEILKSVCDAFIELSSPKENPRLPKESTAIPLLYNNKGFGLGITHPVVIRLAKQIPPLAESQSIEQSTEQLETIATYSKQLIRWFSEDPESRQQIDQTGLHLSVIREAFKYGIPNFKPDRLGFSKFSEFLQFICADQPVCIGIQQPSNLLLVSRAAIPLDVEVFPDLFAEDLQSLDRYRNLLANGKPRLILNGILHDRFLLQQILVYLATDPERSLPEKLEALSHQLSPIFPHLSREDLNNFCLTLAHCEILVDEPEDQTIGRPILTLESGLELSELVNSTLAKIREIAETKLRSILGETLRPDLFNEICPPVLIQNKPMGSGAFYDGGGGNF